MTGYALLRPVLAAIALASWGNVRADASIPDDAERLISKTRTTQAVYSLYLWNRITPPDLAPTEDWSAEFHSKNMHRVETPLHRIIADCKLMTGTWLDVAKGEFTSNETVAKAACGIDANPKVLSARRTGTVVTPFGKAEGIEISDPFQIRTYAISANGALLAATISGNDKTRMLWLDNRATHFETKLPNHDIFSKSSLSRSVVAEKYRKPPETK
jgi:hypothetical protein